MRKSGRIFALRQNRVSAAPRDNNALPGRANEILTHVRALAILSFPSSGARPLYRVVSSTSPGNGRHWTLVEDDRVSNQIAAREINVPQCPSGEGSFREQSTL